MTRILAGFAIIIAVFSGAGWLTLQRVKGETIQTSNHQVAGAQDSIVDEQPTPEPVTYDIDSPTSLTVIVNKLRPLPQDYRAPDLIAPAVTLHQAASAENMQVRQIMEADLIRLFADAAAAGIQIEVGSAYRSAATQKSLYNGYVASSGQAYADLTSARPGYSEHQTGLSIDFVASSGACFIEQCFADQPEGQWLAAHAHEYGFVLRYPLNKTSVTGYDFEPWHFRYLGIDIATSIYQQDITVEEFFGLPPAPDYAP